MWAPITQTKIFPYKKPQSIRAERQNGSNVNKKIVLNNNYQFFIRLLLSLFVMIKEFRQNRLLLMKFYIVGRVDLAIYSENDKFMEIK